MLNADGKLASLLHAASTIFRFFSSCVNKKQQAAKKWNLLTTFQKIAN